MKRKIISALAAIFAGTLFAEEELVKPVTLKDAEGNPESGLVDPFSRRGTDGGGSSAVDGEDGLMRTTMGGLSEDFRILAITIPAETNMPRLALIELGSSKEPVLVREGDLVRVDRSARADRKRGRSTKRPVKRNAGTKRETGLSLDEQLERFVFYVNIKRIEPTYIEVYHNKKRPDETIRLSW